MSKINVHAGDFREGKHSHFSGGIFKMVTDKWEFFGYKKQNYSREMVLSLEIASEESVKRIGGTVGWGAAGAVLLGPVGLLAGLLAGGRGKNVTFVAEFSDGRRLLASTDSKTFTKMQAAIF